MSNLTLRSSYTACLHFLYPALGLTPPTDCCMSGCANCVWIRYAEQLAVLYADRDTAAKETLTSIKDPNLRAFVELELKIKLKQQ